VVDDPKRGAGVRIRDPGRLAGCPTRPEPPCVLERFGGFNHAVMQANQVGNPDSLLALRVKGVELSVDNGIPARVIVPALPVCHKHQRGAVPSNSDNLIWRDYRPSSPLLRSNPVHLLGHDREWPWRGGTVVIVLRPASVVESKVWWQFNRGWFRAERRDHS